MIILRNKDESEYSSNGVGVLDNHIINDKIFWVKNGEYNLEFEYPLHAQYGMDIEEEMQVEVKLDDYSDVFRIKRIKKNMGMLYIFCEHLSYDLIDYFVEDTNIVNQPGVAAIEQIASKTSEVHGFRINSSIQKVNSARIVRKNLLEAIIDTQADNTFINRWGGEIYRNYRQIAMHKTIGQDRGLKIRHRKDLLGYNADTDYSTIVTRIMPQGSDGLFLPEKYVDSPLIINYTHPKIRVINYDVKAIKEPTEPLEEGEEPEIDEDALPLEEAYEKLRELAKLEFEVNQIDVPRTTYDVNFVYLANTKEYKDFERLQQIEGGDTVHIIHEEDGIEIKARVIEWERSALTGDYISLKLGEYDEKYSLMASIPTKSDIVTAINNVKEEVTNIVYTGANGINKVYVSEVEPTSGMILGDIWFQPVGDGQTKMYHYDGKKWVISVDPTEISEAKLAAEEVQRLIAESEAKAEQMQQDMLQKQQEVDAAIAEFQQKLDNFDIDTSEFSKEILDKTIAELDEKLKDIDIPQDKIDQALQDAGFDKTTIDDLRRKASETSETLEMVAEIVGSDGRTTYNKNRATVVEGDLAMGVDYLEVGHNGDGFEVGKTYTISWLAECIANPSSAITYKTNTFNGVKVALELKASNEYYPTINEEMTSEKTVYGIFNDTYTLTASSDLHKTKTVTQVVSGDAEYVLNLEFKEIADGNLENKYTGYWEEIPEIILEGGGN